MSYALSKQRRRKVLNGGVGCGEKILLEVLEFSHKYYVTPALDITIITLTVAVES